MIEYCKQKTTQDVYQKVISSKAMFAQKLYVCRQQGKMHDQKSQLIEWLDDNIDILYANSQNSKKVKSDKKTLYKSTLMKNGTGGANQDKDAIVEQF